jgi:magnesium-protoporphyrin IX monomethyl ester (oxidative) cyclase
MFINAIDTTKEIETNLPPLGLGYLASSLRNELGPDCIEFKVVDRNIEQYIKTFKPHIIGISSVSQNYNRALKYARIAKNHGLPVIMGGIHISALPYTLSSDMDVGVIGEGEKTIIDLFNIFVEKGHFDKESLERLNGIVFRKNGKILVIEKQKMIEPLDKIPIPARDLLKIRESTYMFTSRGCPYRCKFCASCRFWDKIRFFSAEYVVNEIKYLIQKYKVRKIAFWDDLFIANKTRLTKILKLLKKEGILGKIKFTCNLRSNLVTEELVLLLKEMNVKSIGMGLESGSPMTLEYLKGKNVSIKNHVNAIKILKKHHMKFRTSFIIGSPQESREDILQTLSFIKQNKLNSFDIYVLTPFPGTPVWDYAIKKNLVSEDMNWDRLNVNFGASHNNAIILSEKLTKDEIYELFLLFAKIKRNIKIKKSLKNPKSLLKLFTKLLSDKPLIER